MLKARLLTAVALMAATTAAAQQTAPAGVLPVIADLQAKPEAAATIRAALAQEVGAALKEKGCLSYVLYEDREHAGHFMTYETWTDDAAINAHLTSPAMKAGFVKLGPLLAKPPLITRLKRLQGAWSG